MALWCLNFRYPFIDGWAQTEEKLADLITAHHGDYDGGGTDFRLRDTYGYFATRKDAQECGRASWYLYIQFLSYEIDEVEVT